MGDANYLWNEFCKIAKGSSEITYQAIDNYQNVTGVTLTPVEVELMIDVELIRRKHGACQ